MGLGTGFLNTGVVKLAVSSVKRLATKSVFTVFTSFFERGRREQGAFHFAAKPLQPQPCSSGVPVTLSNFGVVGRLLLTVTSSLMRYGTCSA